MKTALIIGGFAESLLNFRAPVIRALKAKGCRVVVSAPAPFPEQHIQALQALGAEIRPIRLSRTGLNPFADLMTIWSVWKVIREVRPQAMLTYTVKPVIFGGIAAALARVPRRCAWITGLGFAFSEGTGLKKRLILSVMTVLYRVSLRRYNAVLFQNNDDQTLFRELGLVGAQQRVEVTAGSGIDTERYPVMDLPRAPVFLMAARLLRDKGVAEYVRAAALLRARHPEVRCLLAGDLDPGPDSVTQKELEDWQQEGNIEYLGWQSDIRLALAQCRIYVLPSYYREGLPRSILEAMAMGRPVITTEAPGCRDAVEAGKNGLLVPVRDAVALAAVMEVLVLDPGLAQAMGHFGRDLSVSKFEARKVSAQVVAAMGIG
jgi:glycosyltransferase involved in cell wall biosynthesis